MRIIHTALLAATLGLAASAGVLAQPAEPRRSPRVWTMRL
jgi:hypothetical protein